jgi:hypothetical protein
LRSLVSGDLPRVRDARPDADPDLAAIVDRSMSVDPAERHPTASAMRDDIERYLASRDTAPASTRGLAALASRLFAEDRRELQSLIDAQLRTPRGQDTGQPTSVSPVALSMAISLPGVDVEGPLEEVISSSHSSSPAGGSELVLATPPSAILAPLSLPALPVDPARPRVSLIVGAAAALGAVVALALADAYWSPGRTRGAGSANVAAPAQSAPTGSTRNASPVSHLKLHVLPASAQLFVDDSPVSNPYVADRARDAAMHRWRAEAPGYVAKSSALAFDVDVDLEIALDRDTSVPAGPHGAVLARTPPPLSAAPQASGEVQAPAGDTALARRKHEIDKDNPYAP